MATTISGTPIGTEAWEQYKQTAVYSLQFDMLKVFILASKIYTHETSVNDKTEKFLKSVFMQGYLSGRE